ncbi:hypothetical protein EYF80_015779 [Liparis tanakae]|uniref:Uncharacterized protein n=1 Tax=Liparis tanakae TaxID=230148 RepID=A0A4Z2I7N4_9TELE|nr:hypothetical protein EYF80_015779 [Liparis tanakae]
MSRSHCGGIKRLEFCRQHQTRSAMASSKFKAAPKRRPKRNAVKSRMMSAEGGHREALGRAVMAVDPVAAPELSARPLTGDTAGAKDKDAGPRRRPGGSLFAPDRAALWETQFGVGAGWSPMEEEEGGPRERAALSLAPAGGKAELSAPAPRKPLGLLSKAAWICLYTWTNNSQAGK